MNEQCTGHFVVEPSAGVDPRMGYFTFQMRLR